MEIQEHESKNKDMCFHCIPDTHSGIKNHHCSLPGDVAGESLVVRVGMRDG